VYAAVKPTMVSPTAPAIGGVEATPAQPSTPAVPGSGIPAPVDQAPLDPELSPPAGQYSRGGLVQKYAEGGAVVDQPDDVDELPEAPAQTQAVPADDAAPTTQQSSDEGEAEGDVTDASGDTEFSSRSRGTPQFSTAAAKDAVKLHEQRQRSRDSPRCYPQGNAVGMITRRRDASAR
jgi:hypothetical protein